MLHIPTSAESVALHELSGDDALEYFAGYDSSREQIAQFDPDAHIKHTTVEDTRRTLSDGLKLRFAVRNGDTLVASINAHPVPVIDSAGARDDIEIGYWTVSEHAGEGYATLAVVALTGWLRAQTAKRIFAEVHPENHASARVLKKAGYAQVPSDDTDNLVFELIE